MELNRDAVRALTSEQLAAQLNGMPFDDVSALLEKLNLLWTLRTTIQHAEHEAERGKYLAQTFVASATRVSIIGVGYGETPAAALADALVCHAEAAETDPAHLHSA